MPLKQKENTNKNYSTDKINTLYLAITDSLTLITTNLIMCNKLPVNWTTLSFPRNTCYSFQFWKTII